MKLTEALRHTEPACISFVGAGGKTSALFRTAREIVNIRTHQGAHSAVLVTTSTHLGAWQAEQADQHLVATNLKDLKQLNGNLPGGVILITGEAENQLLGGLSGVLLDELYQIAKRHGISLLIEADGAHGCPLKAPEAHEPAIPDFTDQVVVVAGMSGLGKPLTSEWVHRAEKFSELAELAIGENIDDEGLVKVLLDKRGGLKRIPCGARKRVLLNQADEANAQAHARRLGQRLVPTYEASIIASLLPPVKTGSTTAQSDQGEEIYAVIEPIGGVILAAGAASRYGKPKQLLTWRGIPLVRHIALTALQAGLDPVVVVSGGYDEEIRLATEGLHLRIANNSKWESGISSSIRTGLAELPPRIGGAVFLQCDQPQIPVTLIQNLVQTHESSLSPIIAPLVDGRRGNPVLFDASTFPELNGLEGDIGGRALFAHHRVTWVNWHDANILIDIDTPADFNQLLEKYPQDEAKR